MPRSCHTAVLLVASALTFFAVFAAAGQVLPEPAPPGQVNGETASAPAPGVNDSASAVLATEPLPDDPQLSLLLGAIAATGVLLIVRGRRLHTMVSNTRTGSRDGALPYPATGPESP